MLNNKLADKTTKTSVSKLSLVQLANIYNDGAKQLNLPTVKKFRDRASGMKRVIEMTTQLADKNLWMNGASKGRPSKFRGQSLKPIVDGNPRQAGSFGWHSFEVIRKAPGLTYEQYRECGGRCNDLRWDVAHGFVMVAS